MPIELSILGNLTKGTPMKFTHPLKPYLCSICLLLPLLLVACGGATASSVNPVTVTISGGFDTDPRDKGRPVILIASALGVPEDVFREAFSHVKPAGAGQEPDPQQVNLNKKALLDALGPYGVTNDLLDKVSNYYRYNGSAGETWPRTPATATAILTNGVVTGFTIINPGAGYTSIPTVTVTGAGDVTAVASISYTKDFATNGAVTAITLK